MRLLPALFLAQGVNFGVEGLCCWIKDIENKSERD